jgi:hypothetical protein
MAAPPPSALGSAQPLAGDVLPDVKLCIGVTGHRLERLGDADVRALDGALRQGIRAIEAAAAAHGPCALRLISGLAEGADTFAVDAAAASGWHHDVVLPFAREEFATDFPGEAARAAFAERLGHAHAVMELAGDRATPDHGGAAYERVGRMILAQSDLLIGIWDGGEARGRGGAAQIIAEAVAIGIPVLHVNPGNPDHPVLLWDGLAQHDMDQQTVDKVARGSLADLGAVLAHILAPPRDAGNADALAAFRRGAGRGALLPNAYGFMLSLLCVRPARMPDEPAIHAAAARVAGAAIDARFVQADTQANTLSRLFRSSFVINFSFAALAVLLSLIGLALPVALKPVLIITELLLIGVILVLTHVGNRRGWHQRWLSTRQLAERLRCLKLSALLGDLDLHADTQGLSDWVIWYARATAREIGLAPVKIDATYLAMVRDRLLALLTEQISYLDREARMMSKLEHRLHHIGTFLFACTAFVCVAFLIGDLISRVMTGESVAESAHILVVASTIATAAFPAIGAAIYGIRMQGDFAGVADRGEALLTRLVQLRALVEEEAADYDTLLHRVRRTKELLTADLASWTHAYHARPLALPG